MVRVLQGVCTGRGAVVLMIMGCVMNLLQIKLYDKVKAEWFYHPTPIFL